jgi:hypothetical protein
VIVPGGARHTASAATASRLRFRCGGCRYERDVVTDAPRAARTSDPLFVASGGRAAASAAADRDAADLLRYATCPACGKADPAAMRALWQRAVMVGVVFGAFIAVCALALSNGERLAAAAFAGAIAACVATPLAVKSRIQPTMFAAEDPHSRTFM